MGERGEGGRGEGERERRGGGGRGEGGEGEGGEGEGGEGGEGEGGGGEGGRGEGREGEGRGGYGCSLLDDLSPLLSDNYPGSVNNLTVTHVASTSVTLQWEVSRKTEISERKMPGAE